MADISVIHDGDNNVDYNIKDATARTDVATKIGNLDVYGRGTAISNNTDITTLSPGRYYKSSSDNVTGLPTGYSGAFNLEVYNTLGTENASRKLILHGASVASDGQIYTRIKTSSSGWSDWFRFAAVGALGASIPANTDITTLPAGRHYCQDPSSGGSNLSGLPPGFSNAFYCDMDYTISTSSSSPRRRLTLYGCSGAFENKIYTRLRTSSGWGSWYVFEGTAVT